MRPLRRAPSPLQPGGGGFTGIQAGNRAGTASVTSGRQATASEETSGVLWRFQKSQMEQGSQPAGAAASPAVTRVIGMRGNESTISQMNCQIFTLLRWIEQAISGEIWLRLYTYFNFTETSKGLTAANISTMSNKHSCPVFTGETCCICTAPLIGYNYFCGKTLTTKERSIPV